MRHFLTLRDYSKEEILQIIDLGLEIKTHLKNGIHDTYLKNRTLAMIFEKSSTRTRVSFETGMYQLGGHALFLSSKDIQLGRGEPIKDTARVISRMCDMVMIRTFGHKRLEEFAEYSKVPVINGLTDLYHPVQLLADYMTLIEFNKTDDLKVAYVGDGNNMTHSWLMLASKLGFELRIATPKGYEVDAKVLEDALRFAKDSGANIIITNDPKEAVKDATVVTTDTWVSMGQEDEKEKRLKDFEGFIVDDALMSLAQKDALFLHCLPAYRGYEVSESIFEAHADEIFAEAENRLHAQKGLMVWLSQQKG
ncbi:Ornithine carbamoyltransferase [hydrothermal vent metagenome]|uniref:ornithine carbamoyltransferase n=1 Tax=hydrothermal vent metagenome TaxID=652676 RepID=A0A1W1C4D5_9ZZZZ